MGIAPVITDGDRVLGESGAIVEYILAKRGPGGLARGPADPDFADYLYWLHFANGTLQPTIGRNMLLHRLDVPSEQPLAGAMRARLGLVLAQVEARCAQAPYLAGAAFSAADIMSVFSLTTMRSFFPLDLAPYPQVRAYLQQRIGTRDAYRRAMQKGDPEMAPMLG
jgi:glutathione S-transferase